jgi:hypothetical protein
LITSAGDYIQLTPNCEGSGLVEIRAIAEAVTLGCITLTSEQADALIAGLHKLKELNEPKIFFPLMPPQIMREPR